MKIYASRKQYTYKDFIGKDVWVLMYSKFFGNRYVKIDSIDYDKYRIRFHEINPHDITTRANTYSFIDANIVDSLNHFEEEYSLVQPLDILYGDEMVDSLGLNDEE